MRALRLRHGALLLAGCLALTALTVTAGVGPAAPASAACTQRSAVHAWSVRRLAWQTVVVPVPETAVALVSDQVAAGAGGVILFGSRAPTDLRTRLAQLTARAPHGIAPLVMTDEEGGAVQRMANLVGSMPSARRMAATMTATEIRALARRVGARMRSAGVTMNLAPVLDLDAGSGPNSTDAIGTRSFSLSAAVTTRDGLAFARGMLAGGEIPVVKHFPGLGQATANTDLAPAWTLPWSRLQTTGLRPFVAAVDAGMPAVMVTNARVPGLTSLPASLSPAVIHRELRRTLGFHGLVLTDSLSAKAISAAGYSVPAAAVRALAAGADMVLFNAPTDRVAGVARRTVDAIVAAVASGALPRGRLEQAALHVLHIKGVDLCA